MFISMAKSKVRCPWVNPANQTYVEYHDNEWGKPVHDDHVLFEFLILEGAQAGLSWETVLKKRENYRKHFAGFDPKKVAKFKNSHIKKMLEDPGVIRHEGKLRSAVSNAQAFLAIQKEFGSFDRYIWAFVGGQPLRVKTNGAGTFLTRSEVSDKMSKDLKKRGFKFVGSTIMYAYMQAVGLTNDHSVKCFRSKS